MDNWAVIKEKSGMYEMIYLYIGRALTSKIISRAIGPYIKMTKGP